MKVSTVILLAGVLAGAIVGINGCSKGNANEKSAKGEGKSEGKGGAGGGGKGSRTFAVKVTTIAPQQVKYDIRAIGSVEAQDVYQIDARVPGTIYDATFTEGDPVEAGGLIFQIAPMAYKFSADRAEADYNQAVANLADAKRKYVGEIERSKIKLVQADVEVRRRISVKDAGAISNEEIELYQSRKDLAAVDVKDMEAASKTEVAVLEATILSKEATWKIAKDDVQKSQVKAPISGKLEKRMVTNGMFVTAGTHLATIVDRSSLKLVFRVSEKDAGVIKEGETVNFSVPAWQGKLFEAKVYHLSNQMEEAARILVCYAKITKDLDQLRPGFFAAVRIQTGGSPTAVVVPSTAVLPTEKGFVAYVVTDKKKAERRVLKIGLSVEGDGLEVLEGLKAGEKLVVEGTSALMPGVEVNIIDDSKSEGKPKGEGKAKSENPKSEAPAKDAAEKSGEAAK